MILTGLALGLDVSSALNRTLTTFLDGVGPSESGRFRR